MTSRSSRASTTKSLGERKRLPVRLGPALRQAAEHVAQLISVPVNTVVVIGVAMVAAQFAPLLAARGLSLDLVEDELQDLFQEARRVIDARPAPPRFLDK